MDTRRVRMMAGIGAATAILVAGCRPEDVDEVAFFDADAPEVATVREAGEAAAQQLVGALLPALKAAMEQGGPVKAVEVCHAEAATLTSSSYADLPTVTAVKRTSLRVRNPANAPDPGDALALAYVKQRLDAGGAPPPLLVQRLGPARAPREWRVYRPLVIAPLCLTCHGDPEAMPADLKAVLAKRYPQDQAIGYRDGDWRGLIRVSVKTKTAP